MKIVLASDHAGFKAKEKIKFFLIEKGFEIKDFGTFSGESCDYPDFGFPAAKAVANSEAEKGVFVCGSGNGMNIVANKVKGVRAAVAFNPEVARLAAADTGCQVICLPARFMEVEQMKKCIMEWINVSPLEERHRKRIAKITEEEGVCG